MKLGGRKFYKQFSLLKTKCIQSSALRHLTRQRVDFIRRQLRDRLEGEGVEVEVITKRVVIANMWEVRLAGRIVHSRRRGDGYVDTPDKITNIVRAILSTSSSN